MSTLNFKPFPYITTKRLLLRDMTLTDADAIFRLRSDERVNRFIDRPKQITLEESSAFIKKINDGISRNSWIYWAISFKDQPALLGSVCLWNFSNDQLTAELGCELFNEYQGMGLMHESFKAVIEYARQTLNLKCIFAYTHRENVNSLKLLDRNDFLLDKKITDIHNPDNIVYYLNL